MPAMMASTRFLPSSIAAQYHIRLLFATRSGTRSGRRLLNIRIATGEIGGTVSLIFLVSYGIYKAWQEFIVKLFK
jgi:hypothetical protein